MRFNRQSTAHETARVLRSQFVPRRGNRDVRETSKADVVALLEGVIAHRRISRTRSGSASTAGVDSPSIARHAILLAKHRTKMRTGGGH
ncbi:MAG: hypothetical protein F9K44_01375 [Hyphomicrobiaceae bacterium]|nr:MAG: hypothetical protein F9K44_01375 [Hyphomicrobiaceae bacterium]